MVKKLNDIVTIENRIDNVTWNGENSFQVYLLHELNPRSDIPANMPIPAEPVARRRRYSRDFTSDRVRKLYRNAKGKFAWRKVPTGGIVFYGKVQRKFKNKKEA